MEEARPATWRQAPKSRGWLPRFSRTFLCGVLLGLLVPAHAVYAEEISAPLDRLGVSDRIVASGSLQRLHSVLVAVAGEPVLALVFKGPALNRPAPIKSLSKTILSAVVGIAIERALFDGVDQPVTELLDAPTGATPRLGEITVGHLLSMQAGLARTSGPNYGPWVSSNDWVAYALRQPFVAEPGADMLYSTGNYHLLSAALTRASGMSTLKLMRDWLGKPLNIAIPGWMRDPQGVYFGGNNMHLSPLALLQFGELYRNDGMHEGTRVLAQEWIDRSWYGRGRSDHTGDLYGYGWFITALEGHRTYYGRGYGGQLLYVIPALETTVVITSDASPPSPGTPYLLALERMLCEVVIPVIEAQRATAVRGRSTTCRASD